MKTVQHSKTSTSSNTLIYLYIQINDHIIMPIGLEDSLALINLTFVLCEASSTTGSPTSLSMLMEDSLNKAKNHTILESHKARYREGPYCLSKSHCRCAFVNLHDGTAPLTAHMFFMLQHQLGSQQAAARFFMKTNPAGTTASFTQTHD